MKNQKGFSLLGMLISIVIIVLLYYALMKFLPKQIVSKKTQKSLAEQGIDTDNYKDLIDTAKNKMEEVNKKIKDREELLKNMGKYKE